MQTGEVQEARMAAGFGRLPSYFIANRGQVDKRVKFYAQSGGQTTWFTKEGVMVSLSRPIEKPGLAKMRKRPGPPARTEGSKFKTTAVGLSPLDLCKGVKITALEPQEHRVNYFIGNDPKKWRTDVPTYKAVAYQGAYKGIDLKFYGDGRRLEYDIIVKPGADPNRVKFQYAGIKGLEVTPTGDLAIKLPDGEMLVQKKPVVYQDIAGVRVAREGKFKLHGDVAGHTYGFEVAAYDRKIPLIIDPVLDYSTYLGGSGTERGHTIQVDAAGCAYVAGVTDSRMADPFPFPRVNPALPSQYSPTFLRCVFVTKFNAQGNGLLYSTYLGGNPADDDLYYEPPYGRVGLAVDAAGNAYITGVTKTTNFPTTAGAAYRTRWSDYYKNPSSMEAFVTKLSAAGNSLAYSTYMRGNSNDDARAIALDSQGNAYIAGTTSSGNQINDSGYNRFNGFTFSPFYADIGFVTKLNPSGSQFLWATGLTDFSQSVMGGGTLPFGIVAEPINSSHVYSGGVWVTGETGDPYFPVRNALRDADNVVHDHLIGRINAFVTWVDQDGVIRFSTYWGGSNGEINQYTYGYGIARGPNGDIYVCGATNNPYFPTSANAYQRTSPSDWEHAILFRFTNRYAQRPRLVYSSYLGGNCHDEAHGVAVDQNGNAYITGGTLSSNFPLQNALYSTAGNNIFVTQMGYDGARMVLGYSTFIGESAGTGNGAGFGIAHNGQASVYVTGTTDGGTFPLINPYQSTLRGHDAFAFKLTGTPLPAPPPGPSGLGQPWLPLLLD